MGKIPYLKKRASSRQLVVHERPFLVRGAQVHDSSFTSASYMKTIWPALVSANVNTVIGSLRWDTIEPEEGQFDFSEIDQIIQDARKAGLKIILSWCGSWKDSVSNCVPHWVKLACARFPRVWIRCPLSGNKVMTEILSPFSTAAAQADERAFSTLMNHLREFDEEYSTVLLVQVQRSCGLLPDSRDRSALADDAFASPVPPPLFAFLWSNWDNLDPLLMRTFHKNHRARFAHHSLSWARIFGEDQLTDEVFMAYQYAKYMSTVVRAGKKAYPIPLYYTVRLVLERPNFHSSPSVAVQSRRLLGHSFLEGDVSTAMTVWKRFSEGIDWISSDFHMNDGLTTCPIYCCHGQPLFVSEARGDEYGARRLWRAVGSHPGIGFASSGINSPTTIQNLTYRKHFGLLSDVTDIVLEAQNIAGRMQGFFFDEIQLAEGFTQEPVVIRMMEFEIVIIAAQSDGREGPGFGLVAHTGQVAHNISKFLLVGQGFHAFFQSRDPRAQFTGILSFEEKVWNKKSGRLETLRLFSNEELGGETPTDGDMLCASIPARTDILECTVYWVSGT